STGDEMTYPPLAHLPRSIRRQRSLQKGNSASLLVTCFLQMGHFSLILRAMWLSYTILFSDDPGDQVVVVGLGDLAAIELARLRLHPFGNVVHEHLAVDFWCVHGSSALKQKIALVRDTFEDEIEFLSHQGLLLPLADLALDSHQLFAAAFNLALRQLLFLGECACAFLVGVAKRAHPVKLRVAHELTEFFKLLFSLSRKTDDERCAQRDAGNRTPHFFNRAQEDISARTPLHAFQNARRRVLQGHIDVGTDLFVGRNGFKQPAGDFVGIGIKKPYPAQVFNFSQLFQQQRQAILEAQILAVAGSVLADEGDLAHAGERQALSLGHYRLKTPRTELAAELG